MAKSVSPPPGWSFLSEATDAQWAAEAAELRSRLRSNYVINRIRLVGAKTTLLLCISPRRVRRSGAPWSFEVKGLGLEAQAPAPPTTWRQLTQRR